MKIWTIQTIDVWHKLKEKKIVICDPKLASHLKDEEFSFLGPYNWMIKKMVDKIGDSTYKSNIYPIWGWYINSGSNKKPDLRRSAYGKPGKQMVCMRLEIPDNKVLLSDFDLWHYVLNNWYLGDSTNVTELDDEWKWLETLSEVERQKKIEESWDDIFNIGEEFINTFSTFGDYIQATFWELHLDYVEDVQIFRAR